MILGTLVSWISAASSVSTTFSNSVQYQFDTNGNAIDLTSKFEYTTSSLWNLRFILSLLQLSLSYSILTSFPPQVEKLTGSGVPMSGTGFHSVAERISVE